MITVITRTALVLKGKNAGRNLDFANMKEDRIYACKLTGGCRDSGKVSCVFPSAVITEFYRCHFPTGTADSEI